MGTPYSPKLQHHWSLTIRSFSFTPMQRYSRCFYCSSRLGKQLNDLTVLYQTIQFSLSNLFAHSFNVKKFYLTHRLLSLRVRIDLGVMALKRYSIFSRAPLTVASMSDGLMLYTRTHVMGVLVLCRDTVCVFYNPSRLGCVSMQSLHSFYETIGVRFPGWSS